MSASLSQIVKVERIDFIVRMMAHSPAEDKRRELLGEWLGELTEDLLSDLKSEARGLAPANEGRSNQEA
ncbi:hypothetical protein OH655_22480 (plasmid) [Pantoea dispersa]|uniref:hypothetical protein n=1 Tax=Pantoea dispersa TaxID=59814 RepID=UPI002223ED06|nr:hypothetical protein [Pantoea dispersa]MDI9768615.1 hypothetical protein [Pantoea dispersa]MDR6297021.1 hypothetical protein [Pantoea dispersa]UYV60104.1 hypothetical protein OH655_22480 [Pantoea dispersa]